MADRYWVGGTANWDATAGTKWSATDGGLGGASVPTASDNVFFTNLSTGTCTVSATANCLSLNFTGFAGTFAGSADINVAGSVTLSTGMTWSYGAVLRVTATGTITNAGKTWSGSTLWINATGGTVTLGDAFTTTTALVVERGTFTTNNYNVTAVSISSANSNTRTINLGSSTVTLSATTPINFNPSTNLTFNAGTSSVVFTSTGTQTLATGTGAFTFYNVTCNGTAAGQTSFTGTGTLTFNNLTVDAINTVGIRPLTLSTNLVINGTLTRSANTNATYRTFIRSDTIGTTRTLTCNAVASLTDIDFRDITIAGSAAPVSGTRLGDCKGNSGISFDAAKTVYWRLGSGANWGSDVWSFTQGGSFDITAFPLAQDTATFPASLYPGNAGVVTINANYNIGTIDMSARTTNTMTLAVGSQTPSIYGNWINGTGTTLTGTGTLTFAGRGTQTITSAGKTFTQSFNIESPSGSVTLQDAFVCNRDNASAFVITTGTFDANSYNFSLTGATSRVLNTGTNLRTVAIGSGTWTLGGTGGWNAFSATNLTVTGTGTISLTSASAKTFAGGGIQTYPTLNQGGTGAITVSGSNKFIGLTNTAIGRIQFTGGTTNEFTTTFNIDGVAGTLLQLGSSTTTQAILIKPTAWLMGANSTDAGNNTGLSFTGGGDLDYLSVSYINGQVSAPPSANSNYFLMFA